MDNNKQKKSASAQHDGNWANTHCRQEKEKLAKKNEHQSFFPGLYDSLVASR